MLLESVEYTRPATVEEALEALASDDGAAPLAGGQSLINVLKNRVASVALLVDIGRLEELRGVDVRPDGSLDIGACVTYDELDRSADVRTGHAILADVAAAPLATEHHAAVLTPGPQGFNLTPWNTLDLATISLPA